MTPDENSDLKALGHTALQNVEATTVYVFFFGILILLFGKSVSIAIRRGFCSKLAVFAFLLTIVNFALVALRVGAQVGGTVILLRRALTEYADLSLDQRTALALSNVKTAGLIIFWTINKIRLINDLLIIWRTWALFTSRRWAVALPFVLWLVTLGVSYADLGLVSSSWVFTNYHQGSHNDAFFKIVLILSLTTNLLATLMIAFQLWFHRKSVIGRLRSSTRKSAVKQGLVLLVESGTIYAILQITYMIVNFNSPATSAFEDINLAISALLPTIMVLIVQCHLSMTDLYSIGESAGKRNPGPEDARSLSSTGYELPKLEFTQLV